MQSGIKYSMQQLKHQYKYQQGVALITALLIVALATIVSVSISRQLQLDVRRTGNILASEQAMLYTLTAEDWARRILRKDRQDNNIDHGQEDWALFAEFPLEGGAIEGQLFDLQACINLNSLSTDNADNDTIAQARFRRLLAIQQAAADPALNIRMDPNVITLSIIDWIDDNREQPSADGAEDIYYMNLEKPYRTANAPIQSISELRVIRGFEESKTLGALKNDNPENAEPEYMVCAFGVPASINVNTAPVEVLESLAANITKTNAQNIIKEREENGAYNDPGDFVNRNGLENVENNPAGLSTNGLSVSSNYFLLKTTAIIGQARTRMYSIIQRQDNGDTAILARTQGAY